MLNALRYLRITHPERASEAREIGEAFVDAVFLYRGRVAPHDGIHALRENAVRLVVGRENNGLGADLPHLE